MQRQASEFCPVENNVAPLRRAGFDRHCHMQRLRQQVPPKRGGDTFGRVESRPAVDILHVDRKRRLIAAHLNFIGPLTIDGMISAEFANTGSQRRGAVFVYDPAGNRADHFGERLEDHLHDFSPSLADFGRRAAVVEARDAGPVRECTVGEERRGLTSK